MAFNLSKADPSASSDSKGKFNLSKTEVAGGGDGNSDSNEPKKSKLGLILLILAIGVGAWFFFSKNSAKNDLVEKSDTLVNADSKNADIAKSDEATTAPTSATPAKPSNSAKAKEEKATTTVASTKENTGKSASATSAKPNSIRSTSGSVNFENGSAELMDVNDSKISSILDKLKSNPNLEINVEGYASSEGDLEFNKNLSQKRADKYASYLVSKGVPKNNIKSIGRGIENPIATNDTEEGRAQNRRVDVTIK
jgi:outer membrane protein OmpA-like peptidoglycan-associated protein